MARKRNKLLDDGDSSCDSSSDDELNLSDPDLRDEHDLFDDPYQRKRSKRRRTRNGKDSATYGVFGGDDEAISYNQCRGNVSQRTPAFVQASSSASVPHPSQAATPMEQVGVDVLHSSQDSDSQGSESENPSQSGDESPPSANDVLQSNPASNIPANNKQSFGNDRPMLGSRPGLGSGPSSQVPKSSGVHSGFHVSSTQLDPSKSNRPDLGSQVSKTSLEPEMDATDRTAPPRRSFLGAQKNAPAQPPFKKTLSRVEQQHFAKLATDKTASVGLKLLQKMGWKSGSGLGTQGEGIVTPLETKARPKGMGLSYKGFEERTQKAKEEDRRKNVFNNDPEDNLTSKTKHSKSQVAHEAWKSKPTSRKKNKVIHQTYEQIIEDLGDDAQHSGLYPAVGEIIDLTGQKLPSLSSTILNHSKGPTQEEQDQRLPELMHNLALICDMAKGNLIHLAKEGKMVKLRQEQLSKDSARSEGFIKLQRQKELNIRKIVEISQRVKAINLEVLHLVKPETTSEEICHSLDRFDDLFQQLMQILDSESSAEYESLGLDELVVCAVAPILRKAWDRWDVLNHPDLSVKELRCYQSIIKAYSDKRNFGSPPGSSLHGHPILPHRKMNAYESLIWNDWLPKIRSTVQSWSAFESEQMVEVYVAWKPILPQFVQDNLLDQLIVPRLVSFVTKWDCRGKTSIARDEASQDVYPTSNRVSLHLLVFPWLEHLGPLRSELVLMEVKLKLAEWIKSQKFVLTEDAEEGAMIDELLVWKDNVLRRSEWDKLVLKALVPKLASYLRANLEINPKKQDLRPFRVMLSWVRLLSKREILDELFTSEFFSKWLETLWTWVRSPKSSDSQIVEWMNWWKNVIPESILQQTTVIEKGFARAQDLLHEAQYLKSIGEDLQVKLAKPDLVSRPLVRRTTPKPSSASRLAPKKVPVNVEDVTFKSVVEDEASKADLLLIPLGKTLSSGGKTLYKLSKQFTNNHASLTISIEDDVIFVKLKDSEGNDEWEPMLVEDVITKAKQL